MGERVNAERKQGNMAFSPDYRAYSTQSATTAAILDAGLRAYMLRVYNWMASGLLLTGIVAYAIAHTSAMDAFYPAMRLASGRIVHSPTPLAYLAMFAPLAFVLVLSFGVNRLSATAAQGIYWAFLRHDGRQHDEHLPDLHGFVDRAGVLRDRRDLRRDQHLWLHDQR